MNNFIYFGLLVVLVITISLPSEARSRRKKPKTTTSKTTTPKTTTPKTTTQAEISSESEYDMSSSSSSDESMMMPFEASPIPFSPLEGYYFKNEYLY